MTPETDQNLDATLPSALGGRSGEVVDPAPTEFSHSDRKYRQVWRQGMVAILEVRLGSGKVVTSYETVIIRIRPGRENFGKWYGPKEAYPGDEDFGQYGWSFPTRALAEQWAQIVIANWEKPRKERSAWPQLLYEFSNNGIRACAPRV